MSPGEQQRWMPVEQHAAPIILPQARVEPSSLARAVMVEPVSRSG
jgi:hypothetical protein